ncbi:MAG: hypothetical protein HOV81_08915 [Kofleriaceae bacterium]|nr:hypothetical protein [Kofleriaceae bacterium]
MFDAVSWLDAWLASYPWETSAEQAGQLLIRAATALPTNTRVALHKETVARLPVLRASSGDPHAWHKGSAVYDLACCLYEKQLPYTEQDIVALLTSSKHDCGHGADVKAPFETAVAWARVHGVTPAWLAAVRTFIEGLRGIRSVKANDVKTKSGLVLLLDGESFASLPPGERAAWERLVLHMSTATGPRMPKGYDVQAGALVAFVGIERVLACLDRWLPRPELPCKLDTAGSHLLRNLVWLLLFMSRDVAAATSCDELVERLIRVDVVPEQLGKKVAVACAVYFAQRPLAVGRRPLETLLARTEAMEKVASDGDNIRKIVVDYLTRTTDPMPSGVEVRGGTGDT